MTENFLKKLQVMQNNAIRATLCEKRLYSVRHVYKELGILTIEQMIKLSQSVVSYRYMNDLFFQKNYK